MQVAEEQSGTDISRIEALTHAALLAAFSIFLCLFPMYLRFSVHWVVLTPLAPSAPPVLSALAALQPLPSAPAPQSPLATGARPAQWRTRASSATQLDTGALEGTFCRSHALRTLAGTARRERRPRRDSPAPKGTTVRDRPTSRRSARWARDSTAMQGWQSAHLPAAPLVSSVSAAATFLSRALWMLATTAPQALLRLRASSVPPAATVLEEKCSPSSAMLLWGRTAQQVKSHACAFHHTNSFLLAVALSSAPTLAVFFSTLLLCSALLCLVLLFVQARPTRMASRAQVAASARSAALRSRRSALPSQDTGAPQVSCGRQRAREETERRVQTVRSLLFPLTHAYFTSCVCVYYRQHGYCRRGVQA
jgi:hypothetical protein